MQIRSLTFVAVLALVLASCAAGEGADTSAAETTTTTQAPTTTTTEPVPQAVALSYALEPGSSFTYEVDLDQQIDLRSEGDGAAVADEDIPGEMSISVDGTTQFTHTVSEGPEPGIFEVRIQGDFSDLIIDGIVDGEPVDPGGIPDVAQMDPIDITILVDEQGRPIRDDRELADPFGGGFGGLGSFGDLAMGGDLGRLLGPLFSDDPVTVGDSWQETVEIPIPFGMEADPVTTEITNQVTGTDTVDGSEVLVIETRTVTSMIEFDLAQVLGGFFTAFMPEDATEAERAELDALMEDLRFLFNIDETVGNMTTWFDAEAGLARQAELESLTHLVMDINVPDEATGEMMGVILDMTVDQEVGYRLIDSSSA